MLFLKTVLRGRWIHAGRDRLLVEPGRVHGSRSLARLDFSAMILDTRTLPSVIYSLAAMEHYVPIAWILSYPGVLPGIYGLVATLELVNLLVSYHVRRCRVPSPRSA